jgi:photosynthetic reaction center cytochrome c subunit
MADFNNSITNRGGFMRSLFMLLIFTMGAIVAFTQTGDHKDQKAAQPGAQGTPAAGQQAAAKTTDQAFKNIQAIKGVPAEELIPAMQYFNASLGVECDYCHVSQPGTGPAFDKDDKDEKKTARMMIAMTQAINKDNFKGSLEVGCATCHSGHAHPSTVPPASSQLQSTHGPGQNTPGQPGQPNPDQGEKQPPLPSVEQVADNYLKAIGGKPAVEKLHTMLEKGTATTPQGLLQYEVYEKAPGSYALNASFADGRKMQQATNGATGWRSGGKGGAQDLNGLQLRSLIIKAHFDRAFMPAAGFTKSRVTGSENLDGHDCYVVRGQLADDHFSERLYFDKQSGLLLRRVSYQKTLFGMLPTTDDFSDYRDVQGVKVAFAVKSTQTNAVVDYKAEKIEFNVPVDDSKFSRPAAPTPGGGK